MTISISTTSTTPLGLLYAKYKNTGLKPHLYLSSGPVLPVCCPDSGLIPSYKRVCKNYANDTVPVCECADITTL